MYQVDVDGTRNVMEAALKSRIERVVHISSTAAMGIHPNTLVDETFTFNVKPERFVYGHSKYQAEEIAYAYKKGLQVVSDCFIYTITHIFSTPYKPGEKNADTQRTSAVSAEKRGKEPFRHLLQRFPRTSANIRVQLDLWVIDSILRITAFWVSGISRKIRKKAPISGR